MTLLTQMLADGYGHMDWDGGWMWVWAVLMLTIFVGLIVWLVRTMTHRSGSHPHDHSARAREILAERFAKGELSTEEYRERVDELR